MSCIDSGGHHTQQVYQFCKFRLNRANAIKGVAGMGRPIISSPSKKRLGLQRRPVPLYTVGVDTAKQTLYSRLLNSEPRTPGYCHFPKRSLPYSPEYFEELTAEKLVTKTVHGLPKPVWELPSGKRNEPLDCRVYAMAALELLQPNFEKHSAFLLTEAKTERDVAYENRPWLKKHMAAAKKNRPRVVLSPYIGDVKLF